jgi:hypothetical protein
MRHTLIIMLVAAAGCSNENPAPLTGLEAAGSVSDATEPAATARIDANGDYRCRRSVTGRFDNVIVPSGATCSITDGLVRGNVVVERGATMTLRRTSVVGNVQGSTSRAVSIDGGRIGGDVQVTNAVHRTGTGVSIRGGTIISGDLQIEKSDVSEIRVVDAVVSGNVQLVENHTGTSLSVEMNRVRGDVQVFKNVGRASQVVRGNWSDQQIQCRENTGSFVGSPNRAADFEGQCGP